MKRPDCGIMPAKRDGMSKDKTPMTPAVRELREAGVDAPETAERHSGYMVGGTSPFGLRKRMPVYVEETILDLPRIYINGGKRGFIIGLDPKDLVGVLHPTPVRVAAA
jgi:Cys-tRNA(Pro) deacylase